MGIDTYRRLGSAFCGENLPARSRSGKGRWALLLAPLSFLPAAGAVFRPGSYQGFYRELLF